MADRKQGVLSALAVGAGALLTLITIMQFSFTPSLEPAQTSTVTDVGNALISYNRNGFALPFEVISILLLAALIGAIIVARKEKDAISK
jgi:NADH-quinone oxidoreductase subunit J